MFSIAGSSRGGGSGPPGTAGAGVNFRRIDVPGSGRTVITVWLTLSATLMAASTEATPAGFRRRQVPCHSGGRAR